MTGIPLRQRKSLLRRAMRFVDPLRYTTHQNTDGEAYLNLACRRGWEGLIAKRAEAAYLSRQSEDWLKMKCSASQEVVIGGYTEPAGRRVGIGALLVGYYQDGGLVYAGKVGTGYTHATLVDLRQQLARIETDRSPFRRGQPAEQKVHWTRPELVAEVPFTEWTTDGKMRQPSFKGLRTDKPARQVVRERPLTGAGHG